MTARKAAKVTLEKRYLLIKTTKTRLTTHKDKFLFFGAQIGRFLSFYSKVSTCLLVVFSCSGQTSVNYRRVG